MNQFSIKNSVNNINSFKKLDYDTLDEFHGMYKLFSYSGVDNLAISPAPTMGMNNIYRLHLYKFS